MFKFIFAAIFLTMFGSNAFAQCMSRDQPGPPRIWDGQRGCYVPQGTPSLQTFQQQYPQQYPQQCVQATINGRSGCYPAQYIQQMMQENQQYQQQQTSYNNNNDSAVIIRPCTGSERASRDIGSSVGGAIIGGLIGNNRRSAGRGAVVGLLASELSGCTVKEVVSNQIQQQPQVRIVGQQNLNNQNPCADQPGRIPVIRANGQVACRLENSQGEEGERPYY